MTPEAKAKHAARERARYQALTPEEKAQLQARRRAKLDSMTPDERAAHYRAQRDQISPEARALYAARKKVQSAQYRAQNRGAIRAKGRAYGRKKGTNWCPDLFNTRLIEQKNRCAICGGALGGEARADHCHKTGAPRGILCHACNVGLGFFRDDVERLRRAAMYVQKWAGEIVVAGGVVEQLPCDPDAGDDGGTGSDGGAG